MSEEQQIDGIVSCLASRSGIKKDAYAIDYQATLNCLESGQAVGARHFVLLSAFCVKNPWLQFQQAKLKFEAALTSQKDMTYSIVRPTAFFKSVSGQLEVIQQGAPFVMFGDGEVTRCNPIAEADLATYLIDSIQDKSRENKIINLGGPDEPLTMKKQGEVSLLVVVGGCWSGENEAHCLDYDNDSLVSCFHCFPANCTHTHTYTHTHNIYIYMSTDVVQIHWQGAQLFLCSSLVV